MPERVKAIDFGIRGFDLAYALLDGSDVTILVDACPRGGTPGSLYVIEPDLNSLDSPEADQTSVDAHSMNPMNVIRMAKSMGGELKEILLVGCEPETLGPEEGHMGLSEPVAAAVDEAVKVLEVLVEKIRNGGLAGVEVVNESSRGENRMPMEVIRREEQDDSANKDTLFMLGGVALVVVGAGLILTSPIAKKYMGQLGLGDLTGEIVPDIERYFKLRSM